MRMLSAVVAGVLGFTVAACSSDQTGALEDSGTDAIADRVVPSDVKARDTGTDVSPGDAGHDSGGGKDTGVDSGFDSGADTGSEHDAGEHDASDAAHDVFEAGHDAAHDAHDAAVDAPPPAETFPTVFIHQLCLQLSACCVGDASASFNELSCESNLKEDEEVPLTTLGLIFAGGKGLASVHHTFSQTNATACLNGLAALSCGQNSSTVLDALSNTCASVYQGTLTSGESGCFSPFDCPSGTYCSPIALDDNGISVPPVGGGSCLPLVAVGQPCADTYNSSDCTFESDGVPPAFCAPPGGASTGQAVCQAAQANLTDCTQTYANQQCISGQCQPGAGSSYVCASNAPFTFLYGTNACTAYAQ